MTDLGSLYGTHKVSSWAELTALHSEYRGFDGWLFRGQKSADWPLATTLERAIRRLGKPISEAQKIENGLVRKFRRQLHLHPEEITIYEPDFMEILAMIQHHGGPTRLLDWSYSFFVAVFFAVEAAEPDTKSCVWAMDRDWWRERARSLLPAEAKALLEKDENAKKPETVKAILKAEPPLRTVHPLNAFRLSERHVYQQGAFLVPGDISVSFIDNLKEIGGNDSNSHMLKIEFCCSPTFLQEAIHNLFRFNIHRATLFPGLDGFAKHLEQLIIVERARAVDDNDDDA